MTSLKTFVAILVIAMLSMAAMAENVDDSGLGFDPVASNIVMKATPDSITIMNLGTAPRDIGGFRLIVKESTRNGAFVGADIAKLPYTKVLAGNPYPEAIDGFDEVQPGYFKYAVTVPASTSCGCPLDVGTKIYLTNGVGTIATAVVA
jgi:hypothetical protein